MHDTTPAQGRAWDLPCLIHWQVRSQVLGESLGVVRARSSGIAVVGPMVRRFTCAYGTSMPYGPMAVRACQVPHLGLPYFIGPLLGLVGLDLALGQLDTD